MGLEHYIPFSLLVQCVLEQQLFLVPRRLLEKTLPLVCMFIHLAYISNPFLSGEEILRSTVVAIVILGGPRAAF